MNRSYWNRNPLVETGSLQFVSKLRAGRSGTRILYLPIIFLCLAAMAQAQGSFTLQMNPFATDAVNPGGTDSAQLVLGSDNFTGTVSLTCEVTPAPPNGNEGCQVSPQTVTPPTGASVTITTGTWAPGAYTITITGTASPSGEVEMATQRLSVLQVTPAFNITIGTAVAPASVPAGSSAQGVININPINGYTGQVTLSCATVTPLVIAPPVCSFNPPTVSVTASMATSTLTITTTGPQNLTGLRAHRGLYAFWLPFPMLALAGFGAAAGGKNRARLWMLLTVLLVVGSLLLVPACSSTTTITTSTTNTTVTPNNNYTFTITGVDQNGTGASNGSSTSTSSVTLGVTTATT